jgi:hypothetical protein
LSKVTLSHSMEKPPGSNKKELSFSTCSFRHLVPPLHYLGPEPWKMPPMKPAALCSTQNMHRTITCVSSTKICGDPTPWFKRLGLRSSMYKAPLLGLDTITSILHSVQNHNDWQSCFSVCVSKRHTLINDGRSGVKSNEAHKSDSGCSSSHFSSLKKWNSASNVLAVRLSVAKIDLGRTYAFGGHSHHTLSTCCGVAGHLWLAALT